MRYFRFTILMAHCLVACFDISHLFVPCLSHNTNCPFQIHRSSLFSFFSLQQLEIAKTVDIRSSQLCVRVYNFLINPFPIKKPHKIIVNNVCIVSKAESKEKAQNCKRCIETCKVYSCYCWIFISTSFVK